MHVPLRERTADVGRVGEAAAEREHVHRGHDLLLAVALLVDERLGPGRVEDVTVVDVGPLHVVLVAGERSPIER